ncbi:hypothetical protein LCGC14_1112350 [marine sediment metagenome]|uniref:Uncharacterized protein n=1 Tax=marine sediment metagenome TaxID=412755 RepID=A0A0F9PPH5_9ZZZZ
MAFFGEIRYADSPNLDAFERLRVSEPLTIFDSKQIFDKQPLFWDERLESGAGITSAHSVDTASTVFTSTLNTAGKFTRQTFMRFNYQPGKSQQIVLTGILDRSGGGTGVQRRIGYFDDDNGLFFEDDEGTVKVVRRTHVTGSPVDNKVSQASWNIDPMDGTGPSEVTIDWTKGQIFFIDFKWLSLGRVRMGLEVGGRAWGVHDFLSSNILDKPYMSTPNLPVRFQMITTGSSPASTMKCICTTVVSEGGVAALGILRHKSTEGTHVDANVENIIYAIVGIRLKSTHLGASITVISASLEEFTGNENMEWLLIFNATVAGTPTWANETNSAIQTFKGALANTVTGGTVLAGGYFSSVQKGGGTGAEFEEALRLGAAIDGTVDEIVLAVRPVNGSVNIDIEGSLSWREVP